jgi:hypothetical protein
MNRTANVGVFVFEDPSFINESGFPPSRGGRFVTTRLSWFASA